MLGPRTGEFEAVKEELDEARDELRQGLWQRRAKAIAIVIAALGTLATAILAHFQPETVAQETAGATAAEITTLQAAIKEQDRAVRASQAACMAAQERTVASAKAEADSVRTLLLGYLLASQRVASGDKRLKAALGQVVSQISNPALRTFAPQTKTPKVRKAPTFSPPSRLQQLSKGSK